MPANAFLKTTGGRLRSIVSMLLLALSWTATPARAVGFELLVPAYFYPAAEGLVFWDRLIAAAARVPVVAILNPASGPGAQIDPAYLDVVSRARSAGVTVIGYVASGYGARPIAEVSEDILRYQNFYPIDGIFVDEMGNDGSAQSIGYYAAVYDYVKALDPKHRVIANPGTVTKESYLTHPTADALVVFEHDASTYRRYVAQSWAQTTPANRLAHLVHQVSGLRAARRLLDLAAQRNAGLVYFTDDQLDNPWDTLPSFWNGLVDEICKRNRSAGC